MAHLRESDLQRLGIDLPTCLANAERLQGAPGLAEKVRRVFASESARTAADPDAALYDGFVADADKRLFTRIRSSQPTELGAIADQLRDPRFPELLFRYRARNWPDSLDAAELKRWNDYRQRRLGSDCGLSEYSFASFHETIGKLRLTTDAGPKQALLDSLEAWGRELELELAAAGRPLTDD